MEFGHAAIEVNAGICIGGGIDTLLLVEMVGLPIGKLRRLGKTLVKEVGPKFLEAEVLDAHARSNMLEIDEASRVKTFVAVGEHAPIVMEREAYLEDGGVFEEIDEALGKTHVVEAEKEADAVSGYLQQGHLILHAALEGGTRLSINAEEFEGAEIFHGANGFAFTLHDDDASAKSIAGQCRDEVLVGLGK